MRLQAKSNKSHPTIHKSEITNPESHSTHPTQSTTSATGGGETYADIASHTPAPDAPVIDVEKAISEPTHPFTHEKPPSGSGHEQRVISKEGAISLLAGVYRSKGLGGWYQGLGAQIVKAVLCQGTSSVLVLSPPRSLSLSNHSIVVPGCLPNPRVSPVTCDSMRSIDT